MPHRGPSGPVRARLSRGRDLRLEEAESDGGGTIRWEGSADGSRRELTSDRAGAKPARPRSSRPPKRPVARSVLDGPEPTAESLIALQREAGNRAVLTLLPSTVPCSATSS